MIMKGFLKFSEFNKRRGQKLIIAVLFICMGLLLLPDRIWAQVTFSDADVNNDGAVNILDMSAVTSCIGEGEITSISLSCVSADVDGNGIVEVADIQALQSFFGQVVPIADAGMDQNIYLGDTAYLDGSNSAHPGVLPNPPNPITSYQWEIITAPEEPITEMLKNHNSATPSITPKLIGQYVISLVVNDDVADSVADTVIINVSANLPPVIVSAIGTPDTGHFPLTVSFVASGTDPEKGSLTFTWDFGDPLSGASNTSTFANTSHIYNYADTYDAVVTVKDDFGNTDVASVQIFVVPPMSPNTPPNTPPAMPPSVAPIAIIDGFTVDFMANASDPDCNPDTPLEDCLSFVWDFGDGDIIDYTVENPVHTYGSPGVYTVTVTVSDGHFSESGDVIVCILPSLEIDVYEAKVKFGKFGKVKGKINLKSCFSCVDLPLPGHEIKVVFDGIILVQEPFSSFEEKKPGVYKFKRKNVHAVIDFNKSKIKVHRHRMLLTALLTNCNGVDVVISFDSNIGSDNIVMKEKHHGCNRRHRERWSFRERHHHHNCK